MKEFSTNFHSFNYVSPDRDKVKVKFASRWYDAEVTEKWNPKSKKGGH